VIASLVAAGSLVTSEPVGPRLLVARGGALVRVDPRRGGTRRVLARATDAAWSADGTQVAFARGGDLWTANADGSGALRIVRTRAVVESDPTWSPGGRSIAYTATAADGTRHVRIVGARGGPTRKLAPETGDAWSPAFSRDPTHVAFLARPSSGQLEVDVAPVGGGSPTGSLLADERVGTPIADARDLSWSRDGSTFAYTAVYPDGTSATVVERPAGTAVFQSPPGSHDEAPVLSPAATRAAFATVQPDGTPSLELLRLADGGVEPLGTGVPLDWRDVPLGRPLFPNLVQRPPSGLVVTRSGRRWLLGFASLVDNRGPGILWIRAHRPPGSRVMDAVQDVQIAGGGVRVVPRAGELFYTVAPPHYHWHLLHFVRFELRRASDFALLVRDRKSGFCLADHYGIAPGMRHGAPRFVGNCAQFDPRARGVQEGTSVGYTDRYPANFHGQNLDVTHVPPGRYWLVHRVNGDFALRERSYADDVASLLVRITWPGGYGSAPRVVPLRACYAERC
jgi:Lysyl oxidase/WD40-like Beta Propeller Repeat